MSACDGSVDNYGSRANLYATARPSYPESLVKRLVSSLPCRRTALDVACGSGQMSILLCQHFERVVALDKSEAQLRHAPRLENIQYQLGTATQLPLAHADGDSDKETDVYFDLVTCAQTYHYFISEGIDKQFLQETCRVLHPEHGRLGIFGYGVCNIVSSGPLQKVFRDFYVNDLGSQLPSTSPQCFWDVDRRVLDNCLQDLCTHGVMEIVLQHKEVERREMSVAEFLNYIRTFSGLENLRKNCAADNKMDPMEKLHRAFEANAESASEVLSVDFPFFLIILKPLQKI